MPAQQRDRLQTPARPVPVVALPEQDVRRKKPPLLSFLLRMETLRQLSRYVSLLALDFVGVFAAIFTALYIKAAAKGAWDAQASFDEARHTVAFAYLVTALLFARSGLYARRSERPGLTRIVASLFQVTVVALIFAVVNGEQFQSFYIFYGSLFFAGAFVSLLRSLYERLTGWLLRMAGYQRRAVLVGTGQHIEAVAHALTDG